MKYKIRKGLDLHLKGEAMPEMEALPIPQLCHVCPTDFRWLKPKVLVAAGDSVTVGTPLFVDKNDERVTFVSPISGIVKEVVRGEKRVVECITIEVDTSAEPIMPVLFDDDDNAENYKETLLRYGLWPCLRQRPYSTIPNPDRKPKALFVSCFDSAPLAPDYPILLKEREADFAEGLRILKRVVGPDVPIHLTLRDGADNRFFEAAQNVEFHYFAGPHPAGTVGPQIHRIAPLDKGETVWYISPADVCRIGRLFASHLLGFEKCFALTGPAATHSRYYTTFYGADISDVLNMQTIGDNVRKISGNVLTGKKIDGFSTLRFYDHQVTLLKENSEREFIGWLLPGFKKWSFSHTFTAWLTRNKKFDFSTSQHGDHRNFVMTDIYDKVFPFNAVLPLELLKACLTHDIEKMEELGIYEVDSEDFALCEVVCPSKTDCQKIIEDGLKEVKEA